MDSSKILGVIIIIALLLSVCVVGYTTLTRTTDSNENIATVESILEESDLNQTGYEANETISTVNLVIDQKAGGASIEFVDNMSAVYNVTSRNDGNNTTEVTYNQTDDHLDVVVQSNSSDNKILLSNKYNYNISGNFIAGGFDANLNNNASVDQMNVNATLGGVNIRLNGGRLNTLNTLITTGGLNVYGDPVGVTTINSEIQVGGLNLQLTRPVADIISNIDLGGINPGDYQKVSDVEYKGNEFDTSENKLIVNNNIRVGGINTQELNTQALPN